MAREMETEELDMDFLRSVDEAVSSAVSSRSKSKRQRLSLPSSDKEEGAYISALKGSHGAHWKESVTEAQTQTEADLRRKRSTGAEGGGCFKCGEVGHWARDCPRSGAGSGRVSGGVGNEVEEEEELCKECPCGAGRCSVLTSNTAKNPGRKFFRCPVKSDMGGCNFFEWCDTPQNLAQNQIHPTNQANQNAAGMQCPCGAGPCLILTTKNGPNAGRQFYRCPASSNGGSCGFFKWYETDQTPQPTQVKPSSQSHSFTSYSGGQVSSGGHSSSSCYKCGGEGQWARDCPNQTPDLHPDKANKHLPSYGTSSGSSFGSGSGSGTCFSCGQAGHWSRDCPSKSYGVRK